MSDDEKKQAWYIANEQGYCLEFRLSEDTVNNYTEYSNEIAKYTGAANGRWLPFKDWLVNNGFKGSTNWGDYNHVSAPDGSDASILYQASEFLKNQLGAVQASYYGVGPIIGTVYNHGKGTKPAGDNDNDCVRMCNDNSIGGRNTEAWGSDTGGLWDNGLAAINSNLSYILLVRPL